VLLISHFYCSTIVASFHFYSSANCTQIKAQKPGTRPVVLP